VSPRYTRQTREPGATDADVSVCRATLARPVRAGATDALSRRQQTRPRALFQRLRLWNCAGARERERQTLDAASVGLAAYASDELGQKHRHWTTSVGRMGTSVDRRQTRLSLLFITVEFERAGHVARSGATDADCSVCRLGDRCYCAASVAPEKRQVKGITASGFSIRYK
jgi:hypothetical protein